MIKIEGFSWRYIGSKNKAIEDVSLEIEDGEFLCIIGPNDSGKTTLAMSMNGLIPNNYNGIMEGNVIVEGLNTREHSTSEISKYVGYLFSDPESQFLSMTVEEELAFGLENQGLPTSEIEERIRWAMELTGIPESYLEKPPYELSGGEKQRVAIASVLAIKPKIIVLDEPTSMLDPLGKSEVINTLKELKKSYNATIVVVEHRLEDLAGMADRFILVHNGKVVKDAKSQDFFEDIDFLLAHEVFPPGYMVLINALRREGYYNGGIPLTLNQALKIMESVLGV
ncbi:MAG: ATP-binding cassette domain-containing protein [Candidatus Bathyarchaeia archaeon]